MGFIQVGDTTTYPINMAGGIIPDKLDVWTNYAATNLNQAIQELGKLSGIINSISVSPSNVSINLPTADFSLNIQALSASDIGAFDAGTVPATPTPEAITPISVTAAPTYNDPGIEYEAPQIPSQLNFVTPSKPAGLDPGTAPDVGEYNAPTGPSYTTPAIPSLEPVNIPAVAQITIADFSDIPPDYEELTFANAVESYSDPGYTTTLYGTIYAKLTDFADLIDELVQKSLDNEERQSRRLKREAERSTPTGWSRPPEVVAARELYAEQESMLRLSGATREALINETTQLRQWTTQILELLQRQDTMLAGLYNQQQDRALNALIQTTDGFVKIYNASATVFNAKVAMFQAQVSKYETTLRTELAKLDASIKQIEAEKVKSEENSQRLQQYQLQWNAIATQSQIYGQDIQNAINNLEGDRLAIQAFGERVRAIGTIAEIWRTEVQAATAENEAKTRGYQAHADAQRAKADFKRASADSFQAQMQGWREEIAAAKLVLDGDVERARLTQENFKVAVQAYEAALQGESARVGALADIDRSRAAVHQSNTQAEAARVDAEYKEFRGNLDAVIENAKIQLEAARIDLSNAQNQLQASLAAQEALAKNYAQIGASALSAVSLSASMSEGMSWGWSASHGYSTQVQIEDI